MIKRDFRYRSNKANTVRFESLGDKMRRAACPEQSLAEKFGNGPNITTKLAAFASNLEATV